MSARRALRFALVLSLVAVATAVAISPAQAAISKASISVKGPGGKKIGREVTARTEVRNTSVNPAITPERLGKMILTSRVARFNSRAHRISRCSAKLPNDGNRARCPSRSQVGSGSFTGIFGQPFMSAAMLGVLGPVSGSIKIYNYKKRSSEQARLLAVMRISKPLAGVSINLIVPVTKSGKMTIDVPDVPEMPPAIPAALPLGTHFVLTKLYAKINSRKERRGRPFLSLKTTKSIDVRLQALFE